MAKPSGAIVPSDIPYVASSTNADAPEYWYSGFKIPIAPRHWIDTQSRRSVVITRAAINLQAQVSVSAGDEGYLQWGISKKHMTDVTFTGALTTSWEDCGDSDYPFGVGIDTPGVRIAYNSSGVDTGARYDTLELAFWKDAAGTSFQIYGIHAEFILDFAYSGVRSWTQRDAELTDRTTAANRIYKPQRHCSSFHVQRLLCHTMNKIIYEARWGLATVPLFGD